MDFQLSQDQQLLVDNAASFVKKESPPSRLRRLRDDERGWSSDLWKKMGDLGWLAIPFPESVGGLGGSFVDVALVLEQLGTTLVPEPLVSSVILAGHAILWRGDAAQHEALLAPMIAGNTTLALAYAERASRYDLHHVETRAERDGTGYRLRGTKTFVLNGHAADTFVVSARSSGGVADRAGLSLFAVDRGTTGLRIEPVRFIDGTRGATLHFDGVAVAADRRLGAEGTAGDDLERAVDLAAAAAVAEGVGIVRAVLAMTLEYLNTREQFGVKIGSFQVLQHRAVDMFVEVETLRSASIMAAIKLDEREADSAERRSAVSAAKAQLAASGRLVTQQSIQLHGGIGITDEHDVGLYFKRMQALLSLFGDEEHHLQRYAAQPTFLAGLAAG